MKKVSVIFYASLIGLLSACSSTPTVERVAVNETIDLSGSWNDTDSRLVTAEMIGDLLARPWYTDFRRANSRRPTVIVGTVRNKSHEHINVATFISDMERELINSGKVDFVASKEERTDVRDERKDQELNATEASKSEMGNEVGADFMLSGQINSIFDTIEGEQVRYYQVDLTLISMADNRKVWLGQKKIKKTVSHSSVRP